jgi:hypothetical protein
MIYTHYTHTHTLTHKHVYNTHKGGVIQMNPKKSHHLSHLHTYLKPWGLRPKNKERSSHHVHLGGYIVGVRASEKVFGFFYPSDPPNPLNGGLQQHNTPKSF